MKYLIGNWKSNKTFEQTYTWFDEFAKVYQPQLGVEVVIAVPFPFIQEAHKKAHELKLLNFSICAQDVSPYPFGAYTGAVAAGMLKSHVSYCLVGHSERRDHFVESHLEIANKITQLLENNIKPVLCVDEPYAQTQLAALDQNQINQLILAYEPLSAIGTGNPDEPEHVREVTLRLQDFLNNKDVPIIYGGSTNPENAKSYLAVPTISGLLPGGSSLKPEVFASMVNSFT